VFPPKETQDVEVWVRGLYESLLRAGVEFTGEACITPTGETMDIAIFINDDIAGPIKHLTLSYARRYAREAGWRIHSAKFVRNYLLLVASSKA